ncbi:MAG: FGGY-family carbohydrate kinase, partial [Pirellulaceae bacterium]|nr:FGGY-family carbohydrate kinase [Pirellulaceae bacterium]
LLNTGKELVHSTRGLLTTVAYQLAGSEPVYALEGSIAIAGALVQWLRDNLGLIERSDQIESLASSVETCAGIYIVPAFSGLFAPHWRADARGVIVGLTRLVNKGHLARAALEATCYQTREVLDAMRQETGLDMANLKVDGGMVVNDLLMQFQADILGQTVVRPKIIQTTCLGAAYAAGLAGGVWSGLDELRDNWHAQAKWAPRIDQRTRQRLYNGWLKAVQRSLDWVE